MAASKKDQKDEAGNGFNDVSDLVEKAEAAAKDPKRDSDGIAQVDQAAAAELMQEQSRRAIASANGGGAFPEEVLKSLYFTPLKSFV
jgi:hypothetical protein